MTLFLLALARDAAVYMIQLISKHFMWPYQKECRTDHAMSPISVWGHAPPPCLALIDLFVHYIIVWPWPRWGGVGFTPLIP